MLKIIVSCLVLYGLWWCLRYSWRLTRPLRKKVDTAIIKNAKDAGFHGTANVLQNLATKTDAVIENPVNWKRVLFWVFVFLCVGIAVNVIATLFEQL